MKISVLHLRTKHNILEHRFVWKALSKYTDQMLWWKNSASYYKQTELGIEGKVQDTGLHQCKSASGIRDCGWCHYRRINGRTEDVESHRNSHWQWPSRFRKIWKNFSTSFKNWARLSRTSFRVEGLSKYGSAVPIILQPFWIMTEKAKKLP